MFNKRLVLANWYVTVTLTAASLCVYVCVCWVVCSVCFGLCAHRKQLWLAHPWLPQGFLLISLLHSHEKELLCVCVCVINRWKSVCVGLDVSVSHCAAGKGHKDVTRKWDRVTEGHLLLVVVIFDLTMMLLLLLLQYLASALHCHHQLIPQLSATHAITHAPNWLGEKPLPDVQPGCRGSSGVFQGNMIFRLEL